MIWYEISAVSGAVAFIVLAGFVIRTLITANASLRQVRLTLLKLEQTLGETTEQVPQMIQSTIKLTNEVSAKVESMQGLVDAVNEAGTALGEAAATVKKATAAVSDSITGAQKVVHAHQKRLHDGLEWATTGIELWQTWKARRQAHMDSKESAKNTKGVVHHG